MPKNSCIMQIWAESGKSALPICNYSQILYQFLTFTQNLKRSRSTILPMFLVTYPQYQFIIKILDFYNELSHYISHKREILHKGICFVFRKWEPLPPFTKMPYDAICITRYCNIHSIVIPNAQSYAMCKGHF